jgi:hypothetical protein
MLTKNEQILLLLIFIIFIYLTWKINKHTEKFTDTDTQEYINKAVKNIYLTDVEAIRLLSNFAIQLSEGSTTIPGNVNFTGTVITDNINSSDDINITGNMSAYGHIIADGNIIVNKNIDINGITTVMDDIIANKNINVNGTITALENIIVNNNITGKGTLNATDKIITKNINAITNRKGIIKCNEMICYKIAKNIGAWLINTKVGSFPIYSSIPDYSIYGMQNKDNKYIVLPGYKLNVFIESNSERVVFRMDNTTGLIPQIYNINDINSGKACKLYYMGAEIVQNSITN